MPQTPHPEAAIHTCALRCLVWQVFTCIQTPYPGSVPFGGVCEAATSQACLCMPENHELDGEARVKGNGIDHGSGLSRTMQVTLGLGMCEP